MQTDHSANGSKNASQYFIRMKKKNNKFPMEKVIEMLL